jgi:hypothetical protein
MLLLTSDMNPIVSALNGSLNGRALCSIITNACSSFGSFRVKYVVNDLNLYCMHPVVSSQIGILCCRPPSTHH